MTCNVCAGYMLPTTQCKHETSGLTLEGPKGSPSNVSFIVHEEVLVLKQSVCMFDWDTNQ